MIATYAKWTPGSPSCASTSCSSGKVAGLIFFETFSYVWTSQVIGNVALSTLAGGPYGCWYYFGPRSAGQMPSHPTLSALGRACSWSLGSISFGSLIVTILEMIRLILNTLANNASAEGNPVEACLACCAACFVGFIESLVEWFNRYAYIEIALYGKAYIPAAKDTWRLFKDRGIDALVNDSLVGMSASILVPFPELYCPNVSPPIALMWGAYTIGLLSSLFAYLYLRSKHPPDIVLLVKANFIIAVSGPSFNTDGQYTAPLLLFSFFIGMVCCNTLGSAIEAGVSTM